VRRGLCPLRRSLFSFYLPLLGPAGQVQAEKEQVRGKIKQFLGGASPLQTSPAGGAKRPTLCRETTRKESNGKVMRNIKNRIRIEYPAIQIAYVALLRKPGARFRFRNERMMMEGVDVAKSRHRSIIFFTAHKCASVYISRILKALSEDAKMTHIDFSLYFYFTDPSKRELFSNPAFLKNAFKKRGYYYGPYREFHNIPDMDEYAVLLVLRDPRDVLTSQYYSIAYSHPITNRKLLLRRREAQQMTVDEYVLRARHRVRRVYETYCSELLGRPNVLFLKYEDMVADFEPWLRRAAEHVGLDGNELLLRRIIGEADFEVKGDDVYSHKRKVKQGDHRRQLKRETIEILNVEFH